MIDITKPIDIVVSHRYKKSYTIDGLELFEDDGETIIFKNYAEMARYLGVTRQALYHKIRANMHLLDVLADQIQRQNENK